MENKNGINLFEFELLTSFTIMMEKRNGSAVDCNYHID